MEVYDKYRFNQLNKESFVHFNKNLEDKKKIDQQQKRNYAGARSQNSGVRMNRESSFKSKNKELSTKKEGSRLAIDIVKGGVGSETIHR